MKLILAIEVANNDTNASDTSMDLSYVWSESLKDTKGELSYNQSLAVERVSLSGVLTGRDEKAPLPLIHLNWYKEKKANGKTNKELVGRQLAYRFYDKRSTDVKISGWGDYYSVVDGQLELHEPAKPPLTLVVFMWVLFLYTVVLIGFRYSEYGKTELFNSLVYVNNFTTILYLFLQAIYFLFAKEHYNKSEKYTPMKVLIKTSIPVMASSILGVLNNPPKFGLTIYALFCVLFVLGATVAIQAYNAKYERKS
ncbi:hypothetical protein [Lysinibacillus sp. FSL K6-4013]|uniref:hypothetical protein n=1 Tax=Lysinibacillus sp. FSL K6-4013 TaxID=2921504 RepID=UPI00315A4515